MPSKSARRGGFSPTTIILILVLLGAVIGAAHMVTPPPALPTPEVKQTPPSPADHEKMVKQMQAEQKKKMQVMAQEMHNPAASIPKVADPTTIEIDNSYFVKHKPGEQGLKQVDEEMKKKQEKYDAYKRAVAAASAKVGESSQKPTPAPAIAPSPVH